QDARQNHVKEGYSTNAAQKKGSKKYPLTLTVTSEERKQEVEKMLTEANLYAVITVDTDNKAVESISELTALLQTAGTVKLEKTPARNEPCSCGSGKKYKKCCG
ncbi:MAG: zinc chelation protein SecC, partial [Oceanospirillaceae bacterium]|nr:zinc chelation protein SecC [Oceanospirillaceae bacterium]